MEMTKAGSHVATERGYAGGQLIEPGEPVPADIPVGSWMEAVDSNAGKASRQSAKAD